MGAARYATLPMRFSNGPDHLHVRHAPLLGEHTAELLAEIGLGDDEISDLEREGVIGRVPAGAGAVTA
jgi:crotonobetainyl-CoA:carnitine CoA-transferase CaiB-like acyl-CoA transferase